MKLNARTSSSTKKEMPQGCKITLDFFVLMTSQAVLLWRPKSKWTQFEQVKPTSIQAYSNLHLQQLHWLFTCSVLNIS